MRNFWLILQFALTFISTAIFSQRDLETITSEEELKQFITQASWVCVNDYESQLLQERTGWSPQQIGDQVQAYIVTLGSKGSQIYVDGQQYDIPTAKTRNIADPTGCGDAYRAGLLYGLTNDMDWETTVRIAALMGAIKIETHGTQNHRFDRAEFRERYQESFGAGFE